MDKFSLKDSGRGDSEAGDSDCEMGRESPLLGEGFGELFTPDGHHRLHPGRHPESVTLQKFCLYTIKNRFFTISTFQPDKFGIKVMKRAEKELVFLQKGSTFLSGSYVETIKSFLRCESP